jgi:hypothetical protein
VTLLLLGMLMLWATVTVTVLASMLVTGSEWA